MSQLDCSIVDVPFRVVLSMFYPSQGQDPCSLLEPSRNLHGVSDLTDVTLVSQDNILLPSYQTMETIFLTFRDFDVDTIASATSTKVNTREFSK